MSNPLCSALLAVTLVAPALAHAANFELSPTRLETSRDRQTGQVSIRNDGADPLELELEVATWSQHRSGAPDLTPTTDVVVTPAKVSIAPGQSAQVQVQTTPRTDPLERTYRLVVREARRAAAVETPPATVPIFVLPDRVAPRPELATPRLLGCTAMVDLKNSGNAHLEARRILIRAHDTEGHVVAEAEETNRFVLSGVTRTYSTVLPHQACDEATRVSVEIDVGDHVLTAASAPRASLR